MTNYRISVLMGIYNCAPTLQEALDSLYAQTFQNFKIFYVMTAAMMIRSQLQSVMPMNIPEKLQ